MLTVYGAIDHTVLKHDMLTVMIPASQHYMARSGLARLSTAHETMTLIGYPHMHQTPFPDTDRLGTGGALKRREGRSVEGSQFAA